LVLSSMSVNELKSELRALGLPVSGRKAELLQRLAVHRQQNQKSSQSHHKPQEHLSESNRAASRSNTLNSVTATASPQTRAMSKAELEGNTLVVLKSLLRERGLPLSGRKAHLVKRLLAASSNGTENVYSSSAHLDAGSPVVVARKAPEIATEAAALRLSASLSLLQLRTSLKARGIRSATGSKMELARRLHCAILVENAAEDDEIEDMGDANMEVEVSPKATDTDTVTESTFPVNEMTVVALKTELRLRGLPQSGTKAQLASRLRRVRAAKETRAPNL